MNISEICDNWDNSILIDEDTSEKILGYKKIVKCFGSWPSFEDFEIVEMTLTRGDMLAKMRNSEWSGVWPEANIVAVPPPNTEFSSLRVQLTFKGLHEVLLNQFGYQNAICGVGIERVYSDRLRKKVFSISWGGGAVPHEGYIQCDEVLAEIISE